MALKRLTGLAFSVVLLATIFSSVGTAQFGKKSFRWLGEGYGPGFNHCNPGPNSDYYNPYSAHNSMLISRLPQFQNHNFKSYSLNNMESRTVYQGVPFSVYAAPPSQQNFATPGTNQMNSFVPYSPNANDLPPVDSDDVDLEMDIEEINPSETPSDPGTFPNDSTFPNDPKVNDAPVHQDEVSGFRLQTAPNRYRTGSTTQLNHPAYSKASFQNQKPNQRSELFNPFAEK